MILKMIWTWQVFMQWNQSCKYILTYQISQWNFLYKRRDFCLFNLLMYFNAPRNVPDSCGYSVAQACPTLCDPVDCSTTGFLSFTISWSLLKLMSIESVMPSNHLILCRPLLLLPSIFPSIRVFSNESALRIRWPKYWSFSSIISPFNEYSGLISFRMDQLDLLAVQGLSLRVQDSQESSTPQFKSISSSVLRFLYGPTLTPTHDYWKNHSFD